MATKINNPSIGLGTTAAPVVITVGLNTYSFVNGVLVEMT